MSGRWDLLIRDALRFDGSGKAPHTEDLRSATAASPPAAPASTPHGPTVSSVWIAGVQAWDGRDVTPALGTQRLGRTLRAGATMAATATRAAG